MSDEIVKIFAAICIAIVSAWLVSFIASSAVKPKEIAQNAVTIEIPEGGITMTKTKIGDSQGSSAGKKSGSEPVLALIASADIARGQKLSKACTACHTFDKGGKKKIGPNLFGIVNRAKASKADFKYSDALKSLGGQWDYKSLNGFLTKPKNYAPGTAMSYAGVKKAKDRAALIAWLRTLSDSPAALPSAAQIAAEAE